MEDSQRVYVVGIMLVVLCVICIFVVCLLILIAAALFHLYMLLYMMGIQLHILGQCYHKILVTLSK